MEAWRLAVPGLVAHRGGAREAPENTLLAMLQGLASGATHLEVDVRGTRDRIPVCIHDPTLSRTCLTSGRVDSMTLRELKDGDPCALFDEHAGIATGSRPPPAGLDVELFRIPTLDDVLRLLPGVPVMIDLKDTAPAESVANVLHNWNRTRDVLLQGYDDEVLHAVAELAPEVPCAAGKEGTQTFFETEETDADAIVVPLEYEGVGLVDRDFIERAHACGAGFWVWTINDADEAARLLAMGVDGIITDVPRHLSRVREAKLRGDVAAR